MAPELVAADVHAKVLALRPETIDSIDFGALVRTRDVVLTGCAWATYAV